MSVLDAPLQKLRQAYGTGRVVLIERKGGGTVAYLNADTIIQMLTECGYDRAALILEKQVLDAQTKYLQNFAGKD